MIYPVEIFLGVVSVWLVILSFWLYKTVKHYQNLIKAGKSVNLVQILENIINQQNTNSERITSIAQEVRTQEQIGKKHLQKYALTRFNPFEDTGGDQSFIIALLDGEDNGIVISSLHTRNGTRVYAKAVANGKAGSHQLSKEEKEVVEKAAHRGQV